MSGTFSKTDEYFSQDNMPAWETQYRKEIIMIKEALCLLW